MPALLLAPCPALAPNFTQRSCRARHLTVLASQQQQQRRRQAAAERRQTVAAVTALATSLAAAPAALAAAAPAAADPQTAQLLADLALLDAQSAGTLSAVLKPALTIATVLMIVRIVMSWSPEIDSKSLPWVIAYTPTEAILVATRKVVPPFNGLDVSPIVWVALLSFLSEILTGPQGILALIQRGAQII